MKPGKSKDKNGPVVSSAQTPVHVLVSGAADVAETNALKAESLRWIFSILAASLVYIVIAKLVLANYHPDIAAIEKAAQSMFFDVGILHPEPIEALLFRLAVVLMFPLIIGFYALFTRARFIDKMTGEAVYVSISASVATFVSVLLYMGLAANNPFGENGGWFRAENNRDNVSPTNFEFYFKGIFTGDHILIYLFVVLPVVALLFFLGFRKYNLGSRRYISNIISVAGYPVVSFAVIAIVLMNSISFPHTDENKFDFNAVYYSMTQVYAGVPMLVNGFTNTYGLYPHFLNPVFQLIGLNVFKFALLMSLLLGLTFVLNFIFLRHFVRNRALLFLGFASVLFFPYLDFKLLTIFDCLFSLYPIRYIVPSVLCFMAMLYFTKRSVKMYWATFIVSALFVLWNPEIGMVCYITWMLSTIYSDFYDEAGVIAAKRIARHAVNAIVVILGVFGAYMLLIYVAYGSWPDMSLLFSTIGYFGIYGVGLLPMSLIHPWNISVLVLLCGFMYSVSKWYHKEITPRATIFLLVSLIGTGYFVYFQGRSQNSNFSLSSGFTLILLVLLLDELWEKARRMNIPLFNFIFVPGLAIISFSYFEIILNAGKIKDLVYQEEDRKKHVVEENQLEEEMEFLLSNTVEKEKVLMFTVKKYQGLFFGGNKRISAFNPGLMDMFLRKDMARMEQTIIDSSAKVFMVRNMKLYEYLERSAGAIAATYEPKKVSKRFAILEKRKIRIPAKTFFVDREKVLLHRKYTDDTAGISMRINDAKGIDPLRPDSAFSVEALFYSLSQPLEYPTIIGNLADSSGFAIGYTDNKFYFGVNALGATVGLRFNQWIYAVMNVYPHFTDIYVNGRMIARAPLNKAIRQSTLPVRVGAFKVFNYYIGPISEVAVSNKVLDSAQVAKTWEKISLSIRQ